MRSARLEAVHASVRLAGASSFSAASIVKMLISSQRVALADLVVVEVVRGRDLDAAGAEFGVDVVVGDDGNLAVRQRQCATCLADQAAW